MSPDGREQLALGLEGDRLWVSEPTRRMSYVRQVDGTFQYVSSVNGKAYRARIIDPATVEFFANHVEATQRFTRVGGAAVQAPELIYGKYDAVIRDPSNPGVHVFGLSGNILKWAVSLQSPVGVYQFRKTDNRYHSKYGSDALRIINRYTVEVGPPNGGPGPRYVYTRVGDASPTYFAEADRNWNAWEAGWKASNAEKWAAEEAEWQAHLDSVNNMPASGTGVANVVGGFMKGFSEATAANQAMEQSMENAINRGLAEGAAEYARRNDSQAASSSSSSGAAVRRSAGSASGSGSGLIIEDAEPAPQAPAPTKPVNGPYYASCLAFREGGPEGTTRAGTVYFSDVAQVADSFDSGHEKILTNNFLAEVRARYGKYNFGQCKYHRDASVAREFVSADGPRQNHRGKEMVDTGIAPRLN